MTRSSFVHLAVAGALAALLLAGCGRKGPLDPPPGAWVTPPGTVSHQRAAPASANTEYGPDGKPIAPAGPQRRIPADWLID